MAQLWKSDLNPENILKMDITFSLKPPSSFMLLHTVSTWLPLNVYLLPFPQIHAHSHLYPHISTRRSNGHLRFDRAEAERLVFPTKTEFSSVSGNSNILVAQVKILKLCLTPLFLMSHIKFITKPCQLYLQNISRSMN